MILFKPVTIDNQNQFCKIAIISEDSTIFSEKSYPKPKAEIICKNLNKENKKWLIDFNNLFDHTIGDAFAITYKKLNDFLLKYQSENATKCPTCNNPTMIFTDYRDKICPDCEEKKWIRN